MNPATTVQVLTASVTDTVATLTPTAKVGAVLVQNLDASNDVYFSIDGTTPVAGFGNGAIKLKAGGFIAFNADEVEVVKAICDTGLTADLQVLCRPQAGPLW